MNEADIAQNILRRHAEAENRMNPFLGLWRSMGVYVKPDRDVMGVDLSRNAPNVAAFDLFDGTASAGNLVYAAGCMSYLTPADEPWFRFDPPQSLANSETVKAWCSEVTEVTQKALATSNFYSQIHEAWLEDGAFGTASIFTEPGDTEPLRFTAREIGAYSVLENAWSEIDTWFHKFPMTHRQAVQMFGESNVPDDVREKAMKGGAEAEQEASYVHAIYPREDAERDSLKLDGPNMPVASVYICPRTKKLLRVSGFWEAPEATGRYMKWGRQPWGLAPFIFALADQRQLNDLQRNMDTLAEVAAFPRVIANSELEGSIDMRMSGVTYHRDINAAAKEWLTGGRYDIGLDRVKERQAAVNRAFHVELFQMFAGIPPTKQMTATEVAERRREKLTLFSPTFARKTSELLTPMLRRVFAVLLRGGMFPEPPRELIQMTPVGAVIADPEVTYTSRIALELEAIRSGGFQRVLAMFAPLAQVKPEILDSVNFDAAFRDSLRANGVPEAWITEDTDVAAIREQRAQAMAEQEAKAEAAASVATAAEAQKAGLLDGLAA